MNLEIAYYEIKPKSTISKRVLEYANKHAVWEDYGEFNHMFLDNFYQDFVIHDLFLMRLYDKLPFIAALINFKPFSIYDWHTDTSAHRHTGINLLLTEDCHCHTVFSLDRGKVTKNACTFIEVKYKPDTYCLMNTEIQHMITNFEKERMILTITFKDSSITYLDALKEVLGLEQ